MTGRRGRVDAPVRSPQRDKRKVWAARQRGPTEVDAYPAGQSGGVTVTANKKRRGKNSAPFVI